MTGESSTLRTPIVSHPRAQDSRPVRVLVADDHQIFRAGLCKLLESEPGFDVVGEADDGAAALALVQRLNPDFLLLDLSMPKMSGLETLNELSAAGCKCHIVLLAAAIEKSQVLEALRLGARGVVLKDSAIGLLFKCIRTVMAGEYWLDRDSVADLVLHLRQAPGPRATPAKKTFRLTPRELQVISTVVAGYPNKEIARRFSISEDTVKHHLSSIFDKCGVSNRLELAIFAINHHLVRE
jgi:DNA-binding NarL/FixJ family response regulator